jgi:hypothetical protein
VDTIVRVMVSWLARLPAVNGPSRLLVVPTRARGPGVSTSGEPMRPVALTRGEGALMRTQPAYYAGSDVSPASGGRVAVGQVTRMELWRRPRRGRQKTGATRASRPGVRSYLMTLVTRPEPTVRPPSRIAKSRPSSMATGWMSSTFMEVLSPGMTISVPSGRVTTPVTSVVRK